MTHTLHLGDCRTVLATLDDASIDAIVCDPPYELGFMGKAWDNTGIAYDVTVWQQCLRVLKPGGHLVAFGGSRTYHRLAVAIEDAGFEIRDQIQWIYASGFPKSHNLKDDWQGWGTALKPAHEPAVLARKPLCGTVADNVTAWGVGALNIDGTRVEADDAQWTRHGTAEHGEGWGFKRIYQENTTAGRWPANVIFDEEAAQILDEQSGERKSPKPNPTIPYGQGDHYETNYIYRKGLQRNIQGVAPYGDSGGASRFFYTAKASKAEREAGLDGMTMQSNRINAPRENEDEKHATQRANHHPTVKPLALMRYLVRLVTPPGGTVLDPFMGSGSTGCAAILERFNFLGIDITPEYVAIAQKRIDYYAAISPLEGI